jgi:hypothetical protein
MSPIEYVGRYHSFTVNDPLLGLTFTTQIAGYQADYPMKGDGEFWKVIGAISLKYFGMGNAFAFCKQYPRFWIKNEPRILPWEDFSPGAIKRAFVSRGSPDEFRDAVRLAYLVGRCNPSPQAYVKQWFTNDCVSFAGNWLGVSPNTPVFAYARGWAGTDWHGVAADAKVTKDIVHLPLRESPDAIGEGDVLCTFGLPDKRGIEWRHIAIVDSFSTVNDTIGMVQGAIGKGMLSLAEWGSGQAADHTTVGKIVTLHDGSLCQDPHVVANFQRVRSHLKGSQVVAMSGMYLDNKVMKHGIRVFLDGSSLLGYDCRGWYIGDQYPVA